MNNKLIENNLGIFNLVKDVPEDAKKEIKAGRLKGMTDISPMWRIQKLTEVFGAVGLGWYTRTINKEIIDGANNEKVAIVDIELYVNYRIPYGLDGDCWSTPIEGSGGSSFISNESKGLYTSDECFKMAYTDALSVACKNLGIGASVYMNKYGSKYEKEDIKVEEITEEMAKKFKLPFGKYKDKLLTEILVEDNQYLTDWYVNEYERKDEKIVKMIQLLTGEKIEETIDEDLKITQEFQRCLVDSRTDLEEILKHYNKESKENFDLKDMTKNQKVDAIKIMRAKIKKNEVENGK